MQSLSLSISEAFAFYFTVITGIHIRVGSMDEGDNNDIKANAQLTLISK